jgi:type I restriction enzyme S subunit
MKRYGEYITTDVPWISEIPLHWALYRAKRVFSNPKEKNDGNKEKNVLSLTLNGVIRNDIDNPIGLSPSDYSTYQIFETNNLVFKLIDLENISTSRVGLVHERGIMSSAYIRFQARESVNIKYFYMYYYSMWLRNIFNGLGAGVRQTLSASDLLNLKIPVPPRSEQDQIVRFLDYKTARIDKLISGYKRQIELLEERKRKIENDSIVNGINPNVAYKDTSAKWMCKVPAHWQEMRTKNFFSEINIRSENGEEPHLTMSQKYGLVTDDEFTQKRLLSEDYKGAKLCWKDDIVLNRLKAHLGVFALSPILGVISPDYTVIRMNQQFILPEYALKLFRCQSFRGELITRVKGIVEGFWRLYTEDLGEIRVCIPPIEEQKHILDYVKTKENQINQAINGINKQITLLQEYRTRLISDVVTGQIDVRDEIIPEQ